MEVSNAYTTIEKSMFKCYGREFMNVTIKNKLKNAKKPSFDERNIECF